MSLFFFGFFSSPSNFNMGAHTTGFYLKSVILTHTYTKAATVLPDEERLIRAELGHNYSLADSWRTGKPKEIIRELSGTENTLMSVLRGLSEATAMLLLLSIFCWETERERCERWEGVDVKTNKDDAPFGPSMMQQREQDGYSCYEFV